MAIVNGVEGQLVLAAILAFLAATAAYGLKMLTLRGATAAFFLGFVTFGLGGLEWALVLLTFFFTSSFLSILFGKRKRAAEKMYAKGGRRDAAQVLANGGVAGISAIIHAIYPNSVLPWLFFCGALAAANADTWATELGVLNRRPPIMITNGKPVEAGSSGAISLTGTLAALAGSVLIGLLCWQLVPSGAPIPFGFWMITFSGLFGSLVDSFLGATVQAIYYCPTCLKETERHPRHGCGSETTLLRGKPWINNEEVNLACTLSASVIAFLFYLIVRIA